MEQKVEPPVKACLHDAARALQTLRSQGQGVEPRSDARRRHRRIGRRLHVAVAGAARRSGRSEQQRPDRPAIVATDLRGGQRRRPRSIPSNCASGFPTRSTAATLSALPRQGRSRPEEFELLIANREKVLPWIKEYSPIELVLERRSADLPGLSATRKRLRRSARRRPIRRTRPCTACNWPRSSTARASKSIVAYPGHKDDEVRLDPRSF